MPVLVLLLSLLLLLPILFGHILMASMAKLNLTPEAALFVLFAILIGAFINIPVKRIARGDETDIGPFAVFGLPRHLRRFRRRYRETVIAVNVGGCVVPAGLAVYQLVHLEAAGLLPAAASACLISTAVCYFLARPVRGLGIAMPALIPPLVAVTAALLLAPEAAPPVAFVAGVAGPLIGADLLRLKDVARLGAGVASIGGAGTFDGIVLSGVLAAYLA